MNKKFVKYRNTDSCFLGQYIKFLGGSGEEVANILKDFLWEIIVV